jgi:hypothetical protein
MIERYLRDYSDELKSNGYEVLRGKRLRGFLTSMSGNDINAGIKINLLGVFDFRAFTKLAMLLSENEKARILRQMMLDIVIGLINQKTGGSTKVHQSTRQRFHPCLVAGR